MYTETTKMGLYLGHEKIDENVYGLLARDKAGYYLPSLWLEPDFTCAMSQFKHAVYTLALRKAGYDEFKAIYLYEGSERLAKCFVEQDRLCVSFLNENMASSFDGCDEKLPNTTKQTTAWLDRRFFYHWGALSDSECDRRWIHLGREEYNT